MRTLLYSIVATMLLSACGAGVDTTPSTVSSASSTNTARSASSSAKTMSGITLRDDWGPSTFDTIGGVSGDVIVQGYAVTERREEAFCDQECVVQTYVSLHVQATNSRPFVTFLHAWAGNAYVQQNAIGLGCLEEGIIHYQNQTDAVGMDAHRLSEELSQRILASSPTSPITLYMKKDLLRGGTEAPTCYGHFSLIEDAAQHRDTALE